ncbi:MAG: NAD-dependent DNA ligase LigA [Puniceicoccales bacterium]|jgi:DNA ligase (NAD+)|nr:NAD-dependent DNA ligase LigA [Puniceicoccales bacterium]
MDDELQLGQERDHIGTLFRDLGVAIARHDKLYYEESSPEISDWEYDRLKQEYQNLLKKYPFLRTRARAPGVGDDRRKGFQKVAHRVPMLSLGNTYNVDALQAFVNRVHESVGEDVSFVVEPKIDGAALSLIFENGSLIRGITRGNGQEGDDVTRNANTIVELPHSIEIEDVPPLLEVRGEVYITLADFEEINSQRQREGLDVFANARNLAAGSLKLLDPELAQQRRLRFIAYEIASCSREFSTHGEVLHFLERCGFPTNGHRFAKTFADIWAAAECYDRERRSHPFATDGAVVKVNEHVLRGKLGAISSAPRWAMAYKYPTERVITELLSIELSVSRTGIVAPIAHLDPVPIGGTTIRHATLHNADEIARKDIRVGDFVILEKAGEVIPAIVGIVPDRRPAHVQPFAYPKSCPACAGPLKRLDGEVAYRCLNPDCPPQISRRLEHFASKQALNIDTLGPQRIEQLRDAGLLEQFSDIFRLTEEALLHLPNTKEKSARTLLEAIETAKRRPLWRLLHGLGIPHVGVQTAKLLTKRWPSMEALMAASREELQLCDGIGDIVAASIHTFFNDPANRRLIDELAALGLSMEDSAKKSDSAEETSFFAGKNFVITGTFHAFSREELKQRIEQAGGSVRESVSSKTNALIVGENPGGKLADAGRFGVPTFNEGQLATLFGGV